MHTSKRVCLCVYVCVYILSLFIVYAWGGGTMSGLSASMCFVTASKSLHSKSSMGI